MPIDWGKETQEPVKPKQSSGVVIPEGGIDWEKETQVSSQNAAEAASAAPKMPEPSNPEGVWGDVNFDESSPWVQSSAPPMGEIRGRGVGPVTQAFEDLVGDVKHGTGLTMLGRGLQKIPGWHGVEGEQPESVTENPLINPLGAMASGVPEVYTGVAHAMRPENNWKATAQGVNEAIGGGFKAAAPLLIGAGVGNPGTFLPTLTGFGAAQQGGTAGLIKKADMDPDEAEALVNVGLLAAPGAKEHAPEVGDFLSRNSKPIGKAIGYGTALAETAHTKNPWWLLTGSPSATRMESKAVDALGKGLSYMGRKDLFPHEILPDGGKPGPAIGRASTGRMVNLSREPIRPLVEIPTEKPQAKPAAKPPVRSAAQPLTNTGKPDIITNMGDTGKPNEPIPPVQGPAEIPESEKPYVEPQKAQHSDEDVQFAKEIAKGYLRRQDPKFGKELFLKQFSSEDREMASSAYDAAAAEATEGSKEPPIDEKGQQAISDAEELISPNGGFRGETKGPNFYGQGGDEDAYLDRRGGAANKYPQELESIFRDVLRREGIDPGLWGSDPTEYGKVGESEYGDYLEEAMDRLLENHKDEFPGGGPEEPPLVDTQSPKNGPQPQGGSGNASQSAKNIYDMTPRRDLDQLADEYHNDPNLLADHLGISPKVADELLKLLVEHRAGIPESAEDQQRVLEGISDRPEGEQSQNLVDIDWLRKVLQDESSSNKEAQQRAREASERPFDASREALPWWPEDKSPEGPPRIFESPREDQELVDTMQRDLEQHGEKSEAIKDIQGWVGNKPGYKKTFEKQGGAISHVGNRLVKPKDLIQGIVSDEDQPWGGIFNRSKRRLR